VYVSTPPESAGWLWRSQSTELQPQTVGSADAVPTDNNWVENQILGRFNWLFAGSLRSGKLGGAVMTLIQSAKLNGHDPYA